MVQSLQIVRVRVKFYASLREKLGICEKVLQLKKNPSFASLAKKLAEVMCGRINIILNSEGELRGNVIISVNNTLVHPSDLARLTLNNGDRIDIMPLPSGG